MSPDYSPEGPVTNDNQPDNQSDQQPEPRIGQQAKPPSLTPVQKRALGMLDEDGSYYQSRRGVGLSGSQNWYHFAHRPGNLYVDSRTADVLIKYGLAEVRYNRLCRTPEGTALHRASR